MSAAGTLALVYFLVSPLPIGPLILVLHRRK